MQEDELWALADEWLGRALDVSPKKRPELLAQCPNEMVRAKVVELLELAEGPDGPLAPGSFVAAWDEDDSVAGGAEAAPTLQKGLKLAGRYRLEEIIGRGGMGDVFRALDVKLGRKVAVKVVIGEGIDAHGRDRLVQEARAAASLNHPNIVALHDVGEEQGNPFLVMELVTGPTLESDPPRSVDAVVRTARQICSALEHAHTRGIVHRDLKPANVLVAETEAGPVVKLVDLGVALGRGGPRMTAAGQIVGTPSYMAPELARGEDIDGRTDLYALGVMMYRWLSGELPFDGSDALTVVSQHIHAPVVPPRSKNPEIPEALDRAVVKLLAKEPGQRFATAAELAEVLDSLSRPDSPISSSAPRDAGGMPRAAVQTTGRSATMSGNTSHWRQTCRRILGRAEPTPMAGRTQEVKVVEEAVRRLVRPGDEGRGGGGVLMVSGESGTGKSRLVAEVVRLSGEAGALVLAGAAHELSKGLPYVPFSEAWSEYARTAGEVSTEEFLGSFELVSERLQENTLRLFHAVESALLRASRGRPVVLIIEDIHWADDSSLQLFYELHLRAATRPLLLVGTFAEEEIPPRGTLSALLSNMRRHRFAKWLKLTPLTAAQTREQIAGLFESEPEPGLVQQVHELSGGNPLFTQELVADFLERGTSEDEGEGKDGNGNGKALGIPESLAEVVHERVARLGDTAASFLRAAAVAGANFRFEWIRDTVGLGQAEGVEALEAAIRAGLVAETSESRYRFRHALVREAIVRELSRERRKIVHGAVADAILRNAARNEPASLGRDLVLAHHLEQAGRTEEALPHLMEAGHFAMTRIGFQEAKDAFERALTILDARGETSGMRRFRLLRSLGSIHLSLSSLDEAVRYFRAAASLPPGDGDGDRSGPTVEQRARVLRGAAVAHITSGDLASADALIAEVLKILPEGSRELPTTLYNLAQLRWSEGRHGDAYAAAKRAVKEAERREDSEALAKGYEMLALACHSLGEWREGIEFVEKRKEIVGDAVDVAEAFDAHL